MKLAVPSHLNQEWFSRTSRPPDKATRPASCSRWRIWNHGTPMQKPCSLASFDRAIAQASLFVVHRRELAPLSPYAGGPQVRQPDLLQQGRYRTLSGAIFYCCGVATVNIRSSTFASRVIRQKASLRQGVIAITRPRELRYQLDAPGCVQTSFSCAASICAL